MAYEKVHPETLKKSRHQLTVFKRRGVMRCEVCPAAQDCPAYDKLSTCSILPPWVARMERDLMALPFIRQEHAPLVAEYAYLNGVLESLRLFYGHLGIIGAGGKVANSYVAYLNTSATVARLARTLNLTPSTQRKVAMESFVERFKLAQPV